MRKKERKSNKSIDWRKTAYVDCLQRKLQYKEEKIIQNVFVIPYEYIDYDT